MGIPVGVAWAFTVVFLLLLHPCVSRLVRLDYERLGAGVRQADLAGLLMTLAMIAMVSPVGAPVPAPGWQALCLLTACWFFAAAVRDRTRRGVCRRCDLHHGIGAAAMLYMFAAMPHDGPGHGVWPVMVGVADADGMAWPVLAVACVVYFTADGVHAAWRGLRSLRGPRPAALPPGVASRTGCRVVMGLGMAGMCVAAL